MLHNRPRAKWIKQQLKRLSIRNPHQGVLSGTGMGQALLSLVTDTDAPGGPAMWDMGTRSWARGQVLQEELPPVPH